jgi:vacuolar-type H+-ATPase subunit H
MAPFVRREMIEKADELVRFARSVFNEKRSETLRKAAKLYRDATLSVLAEKIDKEADDWDVWTA